MASSRGSPFIVFDAVPVYAGIFVIPGSDGSVEATKHGSGGAATVPVVGSTCAQNAVTRCEATAKASGKVIVGFTNVERNTRAKCIDGRARGADLSGQDIT